MIEAFYSGRAGLSAHQNSLDVISNNIANVNTNGYKSKKQDFGSLLYVSEVRPETHNSNILLAGSGAQISDVETDMSGGGINITDSTTDFYINGDGFFSVRDNSGNTYYTKDGSFSVMNTKNGTILGTADGMAVLDANGSTIPVGANGPKVKPGVFTFSNSPALTSVGQNLFTANNVSGAATVSGEVPEQGMVERSNVDLADQMTGLIVSQRGYQLSSRLVSTADQIESMINDLNK
ncbi:MAG TPA: flagellar hook-basal body protein [Ruminiclostridium sp.]|nr:flagellar hook-basal body protein [Ruminiclostridium sp.]